MTTEGKHRERSSVRATQAVEQQAGGPPFQREVVGLAVSGQVRQQHFETGAHQRLGQGRVSPTGAPYVMQQQHSRARRRPSPQPYLRSLRAFRRRQARHGCTYRQQGGARLHRLGRRPGGHLLRDGIPHGQRRRRCHGKYFRFAPTSRQARNMRRQGVRLAVQQLHRYLHGFQRLQGVVAERRPVAARIACTGVKHLRHPGLQPCRRCHVVHHAVLRIARIPRKEKQLFPGTRPEPRQVTAIPLRRESREVVRQRLGAFLRREQRQAVQQQASREIGGLPRYFQGDDSAGVGSYQQRLMQARFAQHRNEGGRERVHGQRRRSATRQRGRYAEPRSVGRPQAPTGGQTGSERRGRPRTERRLVEVHHRTAAAGRAHMQPKAASAQPMPREGHDKGSTRGTMTLMMSACTMHSEEATAKAAG